MPLAPGARILVMYDAGENLYHERHIVAHIRDSVYLIVTPEGAAYEEDYSNANVEILTVRILMNGAVPGDLRGEPMHRFRAPPTAARLAALTEEAEQLAALRGGGLAAAVAAAPPAAAAAVAPAGAGGGLLVPAGAGGPGPLLGAGGMLAGAAPVAALLGGRWRCAEVGSAGRYLGEEVPPDVVAVLVVAAGGTKTVSVWEREDVFVEYVQDREFEEWKERHQPLDARILRIRQVQGQRYRDWRTGLEDAVEMPFLDWPLKGPRTTAWCLRFLASQPGGAAEHHVLWRRAANLGVNDFGVQEHENLMESIKQAVNYDQLNICNNAAVEVIMRRAQTIEYSHAERCREGFGQAGASSGKHAGGLTYEEQDAFAGSTRSGVCMICPKLLEYVKEDMGRGAELMKSILKAREYREAITKNKK